MLSQGKFHAVTSDDLRELRRTKDGPLRRQLITEWDERWPEEWRCSTDKAWRFIYVALAFQPGPGGGGSDIGYGLGADLFFGRSLHRPNFYVIGHVPADWLPQMVGALGAIGEQEYRELFFAPEPQGLFRDICFKQNHGIDPTEDRWRVYSWGWFQTIRELYARALAGGRSLVFSAENR